MLCGAPEQALVAADEAVVLFRECGDLSSEGPAMLQSADALRACGRLAEAVARSGLISRCR